MSSARGISLWRLPVSDGTRKSRLTFAKKMKRTIIALGLVDAYCLFLRCSRISLFHRVRSLASIDRDICLQAIECNFIQFESFRYIQCNSTLILCLDLSLPSVGAIGDCNAMQFNANQFNSMEISSSMHFNAVQCDAKQLNAVQCNSIN